MEEEKFLKKKIKLIKLTTKGFSSLIVLFCLYLIFIPYFPSISFLANQVFSKEVSQEEKLSALIPENVLAHRDNNEYKLVIPIIEVDRSIIESETIKTVHEDVWHRPNTSTPDKGENTVLVAHRYATIGGNRSSTFYHLPKLTEGDIVYVTWQGKIYVYEVYKTIIVLPTAIEIEDPTDDSILTLYTCTPLWSATHRFVVQAKLIREE